MSLLSIRPAPGAQLNLFNVFLSPQTIISHGLKSGDVISIETPDGKRKEVQVARSNDKAMNATVLQMSASAQKLYSLGTQHKVKLIPKTVDVPYCRSIVLQELLDEVEDHHPAKDMVVDEWTKALKLELQRLSLISAGLELVSVDSSCSAQRTFRILQIDNSVAQKLFRIPKDPDLTLLCARETTEALRLDDTVSSVCGLDDVISHLQNRLSWFGGSNDGSRRWQGILLHGPAGTGKSMLMDCVLKAKWLAKLELDSSFTKQMFEDLIDGALKSQPAVIAIHDLDSFARRSTDAAPPLLSKLLQHAFRRIAGAEVLIIAACRSLAVIDQDLRNVENFGFQFEISAPNTVTRADILKVKGKRSKGHPSALFDQLADWTHGYVGRDLVHLMQQAEAMAEKRVQVETQSRDSHSLQDATFRVDLTLEDFSEALKLIKPSALREIVIETPSVRWDDVAGQHKAKKLLEKAITWPLKVSPRH